MTWTLATLASLGLACSACRNPQAASAPFIEFTRLPPAGDGSPDRLHAIEGSVANGRLDNRIVLFARSGVWWVQPTAAEPFTLVDAGARWKSATHPGSAYAALLVTPDYRPPTTIPALPTKGGSILAVAVAEGAALPAPHPKTLRFSGYDWIIRETASDRGGTRNHYTASNAWTDAAGHLHLAITRRDGQWTSAEIRLDRSLGYGSYQVAVRDVSELEPAAVFSAFTWDDEGPSREIDVEISRWGEPESRNLQYVVQPYYVPANVVRFEAPPGALSHRLLWQSGRAAFQTTRRGALVAGHTFTSGVPSPGNETFHLNLYVFDNRRNPLRRDCEVVVERFEYLP